jgi:hypothetical protein
VHHLNASIDLSVRSRAHLIVWDSFFFNATLIAHDWKTFVNTCSPAEAWGRCEIKNNGMTLFEIGRLA